MTETTVDKLKIDINATTNETVANVDKVTESVKNLYNMLKLMAKPLSAFSHQIKNVGTINSPTKNATQPSVVAPETVNADASINLAESNIPKTTDNAESLKQTVTELMAKIKKLQEEVTSFGDKGKKATQKAEKGFKKFFTALKRVAFYRVIRAILKNIAQAFREGMDNLAMYSDKANDAFSSLSSSTSLLKNSLASALLPILTAITPILVRITDALSGLLNNLAMVMAYMGGESTFTKAIKNNKDYAKSLKSVNSQLLSFDKFESLDKGKENPLGNFEDATVDIEKAKSLQPIFIAVAAAIGAMTAAMIIFNIVTASNPVILIIMGVIALIATLAVLIIKYKDQIGAFLSTVGDWFVNVGEKIKTFFGNVWSWIVVNFQKAINSIAKIYTSYLNFMIKGINALLKPISKISKVLGGKAIEIPLIPTMNWGGVGSFFADGGIPQKGTYFYAGEAGAELISKSPSGQTGVTNIAQFRQAMVEALYEYGVMQNGGLEISGTVKANVDGADIASSIRFRNEMNRRNPNLSLV